MRRLIGWAALAVLVVVAWPRVRCSNCGRWVWGWRYGRHIFGCIAATLPQGVDWTAARGDGGLGQQPRAAAHNGRARRGQIGAS